MEILDLVNEKDEIIGTASREEVEEKGLLHRVSYVYVHYNGKIIVEKRSSAKSTRPKHYSVVGETVKSEESFEESALRGVEEEVGLEAIDLKKIGKILSLDEEENDNKIVELFVCKGKGEIKKQDEEVEEVKLMSKEEIEEFLKTEEKISPAFRDTFKVYKEAMK